MDEEIFVKTKLNVTKKTVQKYANEILEEADGCYSVNDCKWQGHPYNEIQYSLLTQILILGGLVYASDHCLYTKIFT